MTATASRAPDPGGTSKAPDPGATSKAPDPGAVGITLAIAVGLILTTLPLRSVFTDWTWLIDSVACAAPYWAVVCFFRGRSGPATWHSVLGLIGSAFVLAWIFVPQHLALGIVPTPGSTGDVRELMTQARIALRAEHAPLASTTALRFMTAGLLTLLAALTDILGVGLRRPLLAGAPMLEILAVASTTSSKPANPVWFVAASVGFLLILLAGTRLQDQDWGPAVDGSAGRLGGARMIAVAGIAAALLLPLILPGRSANLIAKATHHSGDGSTSGQTVLSDFASLRGNLKRGTPIDLLQVRSPDHNSRPFYVRQSVLDVFNNAGWVASSTDPNELLPLADSTFQELPVGDTQSVSETIQEQFTVLALGGTSLPILATPSSLSGSKGDWDPRTGTVTGVALKRNFSYYEQATQPAPTSQELLAATNTDLDPALRADLTLPTQPAEVINLARKLTANVATPYQKARAISDYFSNGQNGFTYSLSAPVPANGESALVTFLKQKQGFCQQYASAAAVLMREAGLPTRVVIGYTHNPPDATGSFTVTTLDAHAWVETYFTGIGWTPFDPTPLSGADAAREVALPYAPHTTAAASTAPAVSATSVAPAPVLSRPVKHLNAPADNASAVTAKSSHWPVTTVIIAGSVLALALLLAGPQLARRRLRRRRVSLALRAGSAEPLWQELAASALDYDVLWPDTLTVGQVPAWLNRHGLDERGAIAVAALADRVAIDRFSGHPGTIVANQPAGGEIGRPSARSAGDDLAGFDQAMQRWARRTARRDRFLFGWVPRSLIRRGNSTRR